MIPAMGRTDPGVRPIVCYTHWTPPEGPALLEPFCSLVRQPPDLILTSDEIAEMARDAFALCFSIRDRVTRSLLEQCPKLRVVSSFGRGTDNVDVDAATEMGIWVATVDTAMTEPVADMTWALLLSAARRVVPGDLSVRIGKFDGWQARPALMGSNVYGKTLGIVGLGQVGRAVARRASGFCMQVLYWQPHRLALAEEAAAGAVWVERAELLVRADFVCLCSPLTRETYHQIGAAELARLKPGAILVNTARGSEVDESAVARALVQGHLGGYATDVYEMEDALPAGAPERTQPTAVPAALLEQVDRTVFAPHSSTAIAETRSLIARTQVQAVLDVLQGRRPSSATNNPSRPRR